MIFQGITRSIDWIVRVDALRRELQEGIDVQWSAIVPGLYIPIEITVIMLPPMHCPFDSDPCLREGGEGQTATATYVIWGLPGFYSTLSRFNYQACVAVSQLRSEALKKSILKTH